VKKKTLLTITSISLLAFGALSLSGSRLVPPLYTINSEIVLAASPERSWEVLTDFSKYPDWNPYLTRVEATFAPGEKVNFTLIDGNFSGPMELQARLGEIAPNEQFYWIGTLGIRGIYDTRHGFSLHPLENGDTLLRHYEEFRGLLAWLIPKREERIAHTLTSFKKMNQALQERLAQ
jgi:hypothetical protein